LEKHRGQDHQRAHCFPLPEQVFDKDDSGFIAAQELINILQSLGEPLEKSEIAEMMAEAGIDR